MSVIFYFYAICYFIWFFFYTYLIYYFTLMSENIIKNYLEYSKQEMTKIRIIYSVFVTVFILGSVHFYIINGLMFIWVAT